jgi:hypothetical protein
MKQFTISLTPAQIREFELLKEKLFNGASFVVPQDDQHPDWVRYNELMKLVQQERGKGTRKAHVFLHKFNRNVFCEIQQSTSKGYKVLQAIVRDRKCHFTTQYYFGQDFADNGGIWKRFI